MGKAKPQVIEDDEQQRVFDRVAAVDVAKATGMVCVRLPRQDGSRYSKVQEVTATMGAVTELGRQMMKDRIEMVTLEATSDYWRIFYYVLEMCGLAVQLVSPSQAKNLKGRPKTDKLDSMWLARLTEWGCCGPASCRPPRSGRWGLHPRPHRPVPGTDPLLAAPGEAARRRADQAVQRGQQADHSVRAGHDHGDDRRGTRPARPGEHGPDPDESQARRSRRGADRHVRLPPRRARRDGTRPDRLPEQADRQARGQHPRNPRPDPRRPGRER